MSNDVNLYKHNHCGMNKYYRDNNTLIYVDYTNDPGC